MLKENVYVRGLFQKPFLMAFLKQNSTADIFLGKFWLFLEKLFHKAPLNNWLRKVFILLVSQLLIVPSVELHKVMCQSVIGELL